MTLKPAYRYMFAVCLLRVALVDRAYMAARERLAARTEAAKRRTVQPYGEAIVDKDAA